MSELSFFKVGFQFRESLGYNEISPSRGYTDAMAWASKPRYWRADPDSENTPTGQSSTRIQEPHFIRLCTVYGTDSLHSTPNRLFCPTQSVRHVRAKHSLNLRLP